MEDTQSFSVAGTTTTTTIENIVVDNINGQNVVYWEDIEQVFPGVQYIRNGSSVVQLFRDSNRVRSTPHCIKHHPGVVLDVVLSTGYAIATPGLDTAHVSTHISTENEVLGPPSPVDTPIGDVKVGSHVPRSPSGITGSKAELSDSNSSASTIASRSLTSLNESVEQLRIKSEFVTGRDPSEPLQCSLYKTSTIQIQDDMKTVTESLIVANRAGTPLDTSTIYSIVAGILPADVRKSMAAPTMAALGEKLDALDGQGKMTLHIVREILEEAQQIKDRLILIESKTAAILTQNYELLEYAIPRLFIVLPETSTSWDPAAMFLTKIRLHFICECGEHTKASGSKAMEWFLMAANQGHTDAQNSLGKMYCNGDGVPQDYTKAMEWFLMAANQGHTDAQNSLGKMYCNGDGVPQDYTKAMEWFLMAANQGHTDVQNSLGKMYCNGDGVPQDYTKAMEWFLMAANQGHTDAQNNLGKMYGSGYGVPQDYPKAMAWFLMAANQGHTDAQNNLGKMYCNGHGVPQDYPKAMAWFLMAANQGYTDAQNNLGKMYCNGDGVPQDYLKAMK